MEITRKKIWCYATGQFGWAMLSGMISNWLVYFYQPSEEMVGQGHRLFIAQGLVILGIATAVGAITAASRIFDAVTDPLVAGLSDRLKHRDGRRIPFLKWSAIPLALSTVAVFISPVDSVSSINAIFLLAALLCHYFAITCYCTPFNALIPELGHTDRQRLDISTAISLTFILGTATAYAAPVIWGALEKAGIERIPAMRLTFAMLSLIASVCLLVPVFTIREKDYVTETKSDPSSISSLVATYRNRDFRLFVFSDIAYWIAITMFQTGLSFFVTALLGLNESMTTVFFVFMTALSLLFYIPINRIAYRIGKKKPICIGFALFLCAYLFTSVLGRLGIPKMAQGFILSFIASGAMAIFGILPQAVVADIARADSRRTGINREGMFFASRTFAFKLGQSVSMLLFTSISTSSGYRAVAIASGFFCLAGMVLFLFYNEKKILLEIGEEK